MSFGLKARNGRAAGFADQGSGGGPDTVAEPKRNVLMEYDVALDPRTLNWSETARLTFTDVRAVEAPTGEVEIDTHCPSMRASTYRGKLVDVAFLT